jgi:hypothetical protein
MAIEICPGCSHKLRIPDGKRGTVTCPLCGAQWFHPKTIELSDVEFRCSMSGARFNVVSSRRSPLHKFVVQRIEKAGPRTNSAPTAETAAPSHQSALEASSSSIPLVGSRVGGWLARFRKADLSGSTPHATTPKEPASDEADKVATHSADEYDWSGFSCPYCNASSFVSCGGGHLACDGSAELRSGGRFHQCFCGNAGFITGTIQDLESRRLSLEVEPGAQSLPDAERQPLNSGPPNMALSPPSQGGPPVKR